MSIRWNLLWAGAALAALSSLGEAAGAGSIPFPVMHQVALTDSAPVRALVAGPQGRHVYAAQGHEVLSFDASGDASSRIHLDGQVTGLAAGSGNVLYAVVFKPASLVILTVDPLRVAATVPLRGGAPSDVLFDPLGNRLYVESRSAHSVTRLDPRRGKDLGALRIAGELRQMAGDGRGTLYVANATKNTVAVVDSTGMMLSGEIPLTGCVAPSGLAMDPMGRRLFVACGNGQALIVDTDLNYTFERLAIGPGRSLHTVFAMHPFGPSSWKGGIFIAGGPRLDAIRMNAFISYVGGGQLPLETTGTALAVNPLVGELWVAVAPAGGHPKPQLLVMGRSTGVPQ